MMSELPIGDSGLWIANIEPTQGLLIIEKETLKR
jgi:hypothetical protein